MKRICKVSGREFEITDEDLKFYEKMKVPPPTLCPSERQRRKLAWRNERTLYKSKCGLCGNNMISAFPEDTPYTVYCQKCWWSDKWNATDYASRDFDFNRPFFEQFEELLKAVPIFGLFNDYQSLQNCEYVNYLTDAKNCYLTFASNFLEDCMYSSYIWESKDCMDCSYSTALTLCYECIDCNNCYRCWYLQNSKGCSDCYYGNGLENCSDCYGCVNLVNKQFCFFNEQLSKEEYQRRFKEEARPFGRDLQKFQQFSLKFPRRYARLINCENSIGDVLKNCKNCHDCYEGYGGEDLKWVSNFPGKVKNCYDTIGTMQTELAVDSACIFGYEVRYSYGVLNQSSNVNSSFAIDASHHLFGCIGMKKAKYCILNKQYSKEEYESLVPKIKEHMGDEWGEFFPAEMSPFAYNETVAHEYYPLTKEEALSRGYKWTDLEEIQKSTDGNVRVCLDCNKSFIVTNKEKGIYAKLHILAPTKCHECRHKARIARRPMRKLWKSKCDKCSKDISTVYSPGSPEIIYCGSCFREEIY